MPNATPMPRGKVLFLLLLPVLLLFSRVAADLTVLIVAVAFVVRSYRAHDFHWLQHTWVKAGLLLWLILLIETAFLPQPLNSLLYAAFFGRWILFAAALAYWLLASPADRRYLSRSILVVLAFVILDCLLQYVTGYDIFGFEKYNPVRLTGPFNNPVAGTLTLKLIFIALAGLYASQVKQPHIRQACVLIAGILLGLLFMFSTGERMAFMLYLLGVGIVFTGFLIKERQHAPLTLLVATLALGLGTALAYSHPLLWQRTIVSFFDVLQNFWTSPYGQVLKGGYLMWQESPIIGTGLHGYEDACKAFLTHEELTFCGNHSHNIYITWLAETGIIGLLGFLFLLASMIKASCTHLLRNKDWMQLSFVCAIFAATFWPAAATPSMFNNWMAGLIWLGIGWCIAVGSNNTSSPARALASKPRGH
ncbi:O-antigen ligase family protein [Simiduia aestuariiviva]|uniref:O-antigen ligase n=1 Tax=Simiduia aestuariiviva TaxID=1510459 RepID=A0A839UT45_9GAMM|nr:O-antigen ligase family protein [Simiduia aestuariiviva]MBB3169891.1 O-antigen ligase [Simiduia aestuariiviva]